MNFLSSAFIIFMIVLLALLCITKQEETRQIILLIASYLFYAYADWRFLGILLIQTTIAYCTARIIDHNERKGKGTGVTLAIGIVSCIGILSIFKYSNHVVPCFIKNNGGGVAKIALPLGISFYTFQALSYIINIYQKRQPVEKLFVKVALYIGFFPQITSGPIVKAHDFFVQLEQMHPMKKQNIIAGAQIFLMGIVKKTVIADRLGRSVDAVYAAPTAYSGISILLATIAYTMQIYADFSGYSDMAIGVAKCIGYDLGKNFNMPYIAHNPSEFWRRWHISLSSWFREYVYFPLGGSRGKLIKTCRNLFLVMFLSGIWHGTGITFILWGLYHGIGVAAHRVFAEVVNRQRWQIKSVLGQKIAGGVSILCTLVFVNIGWILFRSDTVDTIGIILHRIFTRANCVEYIYVFTILFMILFIIVNIYTLIKKQGNAEYIFLDYNKFSSWFILWTVIFLILVFFYPGEAEFIYGKF